MVRFMVLSAPRSASTWVANWLTTERTLCLHDPVLEHDPDHLDSIPTARRLGVACTGLALLPDFVNAHPARKVVVHRDRAEVDRSLIAIGLSALGPRWTHALEDIQGMHVHYGDLFDPKRAKQIYEYLTEAPFDLERHTQLRQMHIEPHFKKLKIVPARARDFRRRIEAAFA